MPTTKTITLYSFEELADAAKENARDWWREYSEFDADAVFDDAVHLGALIGIAIDRRSYPTHGGGQGSAPAIYYSGFCSQGDGACFVGRYAYAKGGLRALTTAIGGESKGDKELLRIATALQDIQRKHFYRIEARMAHSGRYVHSGCMSVEVEPQPSGRDAFDAFQDVDREVTQLMRDFADWIYRQLESEYWWRMEAAQVDDMLIANEYTFTATGVRED
jgi:hypothetical protein